MYSRCMAQGLKLELVEAKMLVGFSLWLVVKVVLASCCLQCINIICMYRRLP